MSGEKSKVIQFPINTRKRIVCQYSNATTTEQSHSLKENSMINYYKTEWPTIVGALIGTILMLLTFYFAALTFYGA